MADFPDNTPAAVPPRPGEEIAPQLERVLQNLNVNLEDELARYRRQRHGRVPTPPPPRRANQRQTIDLISVPATSTGEAPAEQPQPPAPPPPPPNPFLNQMPDADELLLEEEQSLLSSDSAVDEPASVSGPIPDETTAADASLPIPAADTSPDGYLESSEELLKSIAEEEADAATVPEPYSPEKKSNSLLKLAGLVLVLLAGIGVGFAITYPSQLQNLRSQLWPNDDAPAEATSDEPSETVVTPSESTAANPDTADGYEPPGPDLSTREFVELDLESLSTLDVDGTGTGTLPSSLPSNPAQSPLPQPATTGQQTTPADQTTNTATVPAATPAPTAPAPASPTPAASTPAAASSAPAATGSNFYVVSSYTGDASLAKARELVPDAFVRNFKAGARIQLAAFDNKAQAEDQVAFLTQQGATVELFGPTNE